MIENCYGLYVTNTRRGVCQTEVLVIINSESVYCITIYRLWWVVCMTAITSLSPNESNPSHLDSPSNAIKLLNQIVNIYYATFRGPYPYYPVSEISFLPRHKCISWIVVAVKSFNSQLNSDFVVGTHHTDVQKSDFGIGSLLMRAVTQLNI